MRLSALPALVIATGGLSIPKIGATSFGYDLARQFGLEDSAVPAGAGAAALRAEDRQQLRRPCGRLDRGDRLSDGQHFREKMLFTHRGLSGPAILQISSYWQPGEAIALDLAPDAEPLLAMRDRTTHRAMTTSLRTRFALRAANRGLPIAGSNCTVPRVGRMPRWTSLAHGFIAWPITPAGTEGYEKAEVTAGGVDTDELSAKTMESRKVPGLFFIGEVVDVTGHLGGFNFQWAWASGFCGRPGGLKLHAIASCSL